MRIFFIGSPFAKASEDKPLADARAHRARRVMAVAQELARAGHEVTVSCAAPYTSRHLTRFNGVRLLHRPSFDPRVAGGWLHTVLVWMAVVRARPDVVHVHGRQAGVVIPYVRRLLRDTAIVWTIDEMPKRENPLSPPFDRLRAGSYPNFAQGLRWARQGGVRRIAQLCAAVTVPTREVQSQLLQRFGVRAEYVPDGFVMTDVPPVPAAHFGLRRGQYNVVLADDARTVRWVAKSYKQSGTRKKLVVPAEARGAFKRLEREFGFLTFVGEQRERSLRSLLGQAQVVVVTGAVDQNVLLSTMSDGKAIVATTEPLLEETLGVTAQFVRPQDSDGLAEILKALVKNARRQTVWGAKAQKRAQAHFTWARIVDDYRGLYSAGHRRVVPLDSARPSFAHSVTV